MITTFTCRCGLTPIDGLPAIWVESPRTGRRLVLNRDAALRDLPDRMFARVVSAAGTGRLSASFSRDELLALVDACACEAQPPTRPAAVSTLPGMRRGERW